MKKYLILPLLLSGAWLTGQVSLEREVIGSLGQTFSGVALQLSATAGEAAVTTESAPGILLTQGFHQAEPEDLTSVRINAEILANLTAYPNPARQQFWVNITAPAGQRLTLQVLDGLGRSITATSRNIPAGGTTPVRFDSASWPAGIYHIRVLTAGGSLAGSVRMLVGG